MPYFFFFFLIPWFLLDATHKCRGSALWHFLIQNGANCIPNLPGCLLTLDGPDAKAQQRERTRPCAVSHVHCWPLLRVSIRRRLTDWKFSTCWDFFEEMEQPIADTLGSPIILSLHLTALTGSLCQPPSDLHWGLLWWSVDTGELECFSAKYTFPLVLESHFKPRESDPAKVPLQLEDWWAVIRLCLRYMDHITLYLSVPPQKLAVALLWLAHVTARDVPRGVVVVPQAANILCQTQNPCR